MRTERRGTCFTEKSRCFDNVFRALTFLIPALKPGNDIPHSFQFIPDEQLLQLQLSESFFLSHYESSKDAREAVLKLLSHLFFH